MDPSCLLSLVLLSLLSSSFAKCPKACNCALKAGRKTVHCSQGGMRSLPIAELDPHVHELVVAPPPDRPNHLQLGRIFHEHKWLETVRIVDSGIPAIGDSSFRPGWKLRTLDLSRNVITFLDPSDFNGLRFLRELDLADNAIYSTPSAPFQHLINLRRLNIARNNFTRLVPRFFYMLVNLEELDISGNDLGMLVPEVFQDVKNLKILHASNCGIHELHPIFYQQIPLLEELDLRDNRILRLAPGEFRLLPNLSTLHLDSNGLTSLTEGTFHGHSFRLLTLSDNAISAVSDHAFDNASVQRLDVSKNRLEYVLQDTFRPLSESLEELDLSYNDIGNQGFALLVHPLKSIRVLRASNLAVKDVLPEAFINCANLRFVNLSFNGISEVPPRSFEPLEELEELDLSFNLLPYIRWEPMEVFYNLTYFRTLRLQGNPLDCGTCHIAPIFHALNESRLIEGNNNHTECLPCHLPAKWSGRCITRLMGPSLECGDGLRLDRLHLSSTSRAGLAVAVAVIVALVFLILVIIIIYKRNIAHYYTHEEEQRAWKGMYENPALSGSGYGEDKPTFIATPDKVDDNIDDLRRPASILR